jgi:hypothetical protein
VCREFLLWKKKVTAYSTKILVTDSEIEKKSQIVITQAKPSPYLKPPTEIT